MYMDFRYKYKTVMRQSNPYDGNHYSGKTKSFIETVPWFASDGGSKWTLLSELYLFSVISKYRMDHDFY